MVNRKVYRFDNEEDIEEMWKIIVDSLEDEFPNDKILDESEDVMDNPYKRRRFFAWKEATSGDQEVNDNEQFIGKDESTTWFKEERFAILLPIY